jgi:hypothetical protein
MSSMAAILVVVACQTGSVDCIREPLRVVSYQSDRECQRHLDQEVRKHKRPGFEIYGVCNAFSKQLFAGLPPVDVTADLRGYQQTGTEKDINLALTQSGFMH